MTVKDFAEKSGFTLVAGDGSREYTSVYCCDLLSVVMGRAPADCAWVTVMGNMNGVAVAVLADCACIVLAEGMSLDAEAAAKATQQEVAVLRTPLPVYEAACALGGAL